MACVLGLGAGPARAAEVVEEVVSNPYPGIEITERTETDPDNRIRIARISLCADQVHVTATAAPSSFTTPGGWGGDAGVQLAVNGDFYTSGPQVYGDAVGGGMPWPLAQTGNSQPDAWYHENYGWIAFGPDWVEFNHTGRTKTADVDRFGVDLGWRPAEVTAELPGGVQSLVSGFPELVIEGQQYTCVSPTDGDCFPDRSDMRERHPRTAMGLTEDRETFILVVVDGRDAPTSVGMYGSELARLMFELGAWEAFNLDGGGSSAMWLAGSGYINEPSDGSARSVANHWGIFAGDEGGQPLEPGSCFVPGGCFASPLIGAESEPFKDMPPEAYGHDEAAAMLEAGFVSGCSTEPRLFCPSCVASRAQHVAMVVNASELDTSSPPAEPTFDDVPTEHWAYGVVEAAVAAGWIEGCTPTSFCPNDPMPRGLGAAVVRRALALPDAMPGGGFDDVPAGHPYAADVDAMNEACLLDGCGAGTFCPDDPILRSETAVVVARGYGLVEVICEPPGDTDTGSVDDTGAGEADDDDDDATSGPAEDDGGTTSASGSTDTNALPPGAGADGGSVCACRTDGGRPPSLLALVILPWLRRRLRAAADSRAAGACS